MKKEKAITLISLLITIIILIILTAVTVKIIYKENSPISVTAEAKVNYDISKAREELIVTLQNAQIQKSSNPNYNQDEYLDKFIEGELKGAKVKGDIVILDGYAFELDRGIPDIGKCVGKERDLKFPKVNLDKRVAEDAKSAVITINA